MKSRCKYCNKKFFNRSNMKRHLAEGVCPAKQSSRSYFEDYNRAIKGEPEKWSMLEDVEHMT